MPTVVKGLPELKARFAQLPVDVSKKVLRRGGSAGSKVIKAAVIAAAPQASSPHRKGVAPGLLKRSGIVKFARELSGPDQATYIVTFRQGKKAQAIARGRGAKRTSVNLDAFYAKFVERGHRIVSRSRSAGSKRKRRQAATGTVAGRFFFANALRVSQAKALTAMVDTMNSDIKKLPGIT